MKIDSGQFSFGQPPKLVPIRSTRCIRVAETDIEYDNQFVMFNAVLIGLAMLYGGKKSDERYRAIEIVVQPCPQRPFEWFAVNPVGSG